MTRFHRTTETLNMVRELATGILKLQKTVEGVDSECQYEIDSLAQMAGYILVEVEHREKDK